nr:MAG TPA: hypothetical protein [Caudoviricetes sp.]
MLTEFFEKYIILHRDYIEKGGFYWRRRRYWS